mgnify:CR=1 FL=1
MAMNPINFPITFSQRTIIWEALHNYLKIRLGTSDFAVLHNEEELRILVSAYVEKRYSNHDGYFKNYKIEQKMVDMDEIRRLLLLFSI